MKTILSIKNYIYTIILLASVTLSPLFAYAAGGVIPCDGQDCSFGSLVTLVQKILTFFLTAAPFVAAIIFAYGGVLYITSGGQSGKIEKAHKVFSFAVWGLLLVLGAWLIIFTIIKGLGVTDDSYWFLAR